MRRLVVFFVLVLVLPIADARAQAPRAELAPVEPAPILELSVSGNLGLSAPGGAASVMARLDVYRSVFLEVDLGTSTAGYEYGGGVGVSLVRERSKTQRLGWVEARLIGSLLLTRSRTTDPEAGLLLVDPLPELVRGAGTYTWGYLMTGGDLKFDNRFYVLAEVGLAVRLEHDADFPMGPKPDDFVSPTLRAGVGMSF